MIRIDPDLERKTLKLRDAFRVLGWQMFKTLFHQESLNTLHASYYTLWQKSEIKSMDLFSLQQLATNKDLSVDKLLEIRERHYGFQGHE